MSFYFFNYQGFFWIFNTLSIKNFKKLKKKKKKKKIKDDESLENNNKIFKKMENY